MNKYMILFVLFCSLSTMAEILNKDIDIQYNASEDGFLISFDKKFRPNVRTSDVAFPVPLQKKEDNGNNSHLLRMNDDKLFSTLIHRDFSVCFFTSRHFIDCKMPDAVVQLLDDLSNTTRHFLFYRTSSEMRSVGKGNIGKYYIVLPQNSDSLQFLTNHPKTKYTKEGGFLIICIARRELDGYNNAYITTIPEVGADNVCPMEMKSTTKFKSYKIGASIPINLHAKSKQPLKSLEYRIDAPDGILTEFSVTDQKGNKINDVSSCRIPCRSSGKWMKLEHSNQMIEEADLAAILSKEHANPEQRGPMMPGIYHVSMTVKMAVRISGSDEIIWDGVVVTAPLDVKVTTGRNVH